MYVLLGNDHETKIALLLTYSVVVIYINLGVWTTTKNNMALFVPRMSPLITPCRNGNVTANGSVLRLN